MEKRTKTKRVFVVPALPDAILAQAFFLPLPVLHIIYLTKKYCRTNNFAWGYGGLTTSSPRSGRAGSCGRTSSSSRSGRAGSSPHVCAVWSASACPIKFYAP